MTLLFFCINIQAKTTSTCVFMCFVVCVIFAFLASPFWGGNQMKRDQSGRGGKRIRRWRRRREVFFFPLLTFPFFLTITFFFFLPPFLSLSLSLQETSRALTIFSKSYRLFRGQNNYFRNADDEEKDMFLSSNYRIYVGLKKGKVSWKIKKMITFLFFIILPLFKWVIDLRQLFHVFSINFLWFFIVRFNPKIMLNFSWW